VGLGLGLLGRWHLVEQVAVSGDQPAGDPAALDALRRQAGLVVGGPVGNSLGVEEDQVRRCPWLEAPGARPAGGLGGLVGHPPERAWEIQGAELSHEAAEHPGEGAEEARVGLPVRVHERVAADAREGLRKEAGHVLLDVVERDQRCPEPARGKEIEDDVEGPRRGQVRLAASADDLGEGQVEKIKKKENNEKRK
jgi:hypothetical protein